jgi:hypothetical protein
MVTPAPDRRHWAVCALVKDPWRRRPCNCPDLDPVFLPREEEARLLRVAAEIEAAGKMAIAK